LRGKIGHRARLSKEVAKNRLQEMTLNKAQDQFIMKVKSRKIMSFFNFQLQLKDLQF